MREWAPWLRDQRHWPLPDSRLGVLLTGCESLSGSSLTRPNRASLFHFTHSMVSPVFASQLTSYPRLGVVRGWNAFILGWRCYQHMFISCIFQKKSKTGDPTLPWITSLKTAHQAPWVQCKQHSAPKLPLFHIHTMQNTWDKFMSLQFAWQPAFKSPRFAALRFRVSFAALCQELWRNKLTRRIVSQRTWWLS